MFVMISGVLFWKAVMMLPIPYAVSGSSALDRHEVLL